MSRFRMHQQSKGGKRRDAPLCFCWGRSPYYRLALRSLPLCWYLAVTRELTNPSLQAARTSTESEQRRLSTAAQNPGLSDGALVLAVRAGNQDAMAQLYDRYSQVIYAV